MERDEEKEKNRERLRKDEGALWREEEGGEKH